MFGIKALTSLMIFALLAASNFSSLTVKIVFSLGFSSAGAASSADDAADDVEDEGAEVGMAISVIFNRVLEGGLKIGCQRSSLTVCELDSMRALGDVIERNRIGWLK